MPNKFTGYLALGCLLFTVLWLAFMIWDAAAAGPMKDLGDHVAHAEEGSFLFYGTYVNAALLTLFAAAFMSSLYALCKREAPQLAIAVYPFIPVYAAFNLFVYLSQVFVVPGLLPSRTDPQFSSHASFLLQQMLQTWEPSLIAFVNGLAYATLGIPSLVFGCILAGRRGLLRIGGILLALNGFSCIAGLVGRALDIPLLGQGTMVGGVLFLFALIFLIIAFLGREKDPKVT